MPKRWLDRVELALKCHRLPGPARARLLAELRDHLDDLTHEGFRMDAQMQWDTRLGTPDELAAVAVTQHRRANWPARHPALVFGLAPLPLTMVALVVCTLVGFGLLWAVHEIIGGMPRGTKVVGMVGMAYWLRVVPFVLSAIWLSRAALRAGVSRIWLGVALVQVTLMASMVIARVSLSDLPGQSMFFLACDWPVGSSFDGAQILQLLPPLGAATLVWLARPRLMTS